MTRPSRWMSLLLAASFAADPHLAAAAQPAPRRADPCPFAAQALTDRLTQVRLMIGRPAPKVEFALTAAAVLYALAHGSSESGSVLLAVALSPRSLPARLPEDVLYAEQIRRRLAGVIGTLPNARSLNPVQEAAQFRLQMASVDNAFRTLKQTRPQAFQRLGLEPLAAEVMAIRQLAANPSRVTLDVFNDMINRAEALLKALSASAQAPYERTRYPLSTLPPAFITELAAAGVPRDLATKAVAAWASPARSMADWRALHAEAQKAGVPGAAAARLALLSPHPREELDAAIGLARWLGGLWTDEESPVAAIIQTPVPVLLRRFQRVGIPAGALEQAFAPLLWARSESRAGTAPRPLGASSHWWQEILTIRELRKALAVTRAADIPWSRLSAALTSSVILTFAQERGKPAGDLIWLTDDEIRREPILALSDPAAGREYTLAGFVDALPVHQTAGRPLALPLAERVGLLDPSLGMRDPKDFLISIEGLAAALSANLIADIPWETLPLSLCRQLIEALAAQVKVVPAQLTGLHYRNSVLRALGPAAVARGITLEGLYRRFHRDWSAAPRGVSVERYIAETLWPEETRALDQSLRDAADAAQRARRLKEIRQQIAGQRQALQPKSGLRLWIWMHLGIPLYLIAQRRQQAVEEVEGLLRIQKKAFSRRTRKDPWLFTTALGWLLAAMEMELKRLENEANAQADIARQQQADRRALREQDAAARRAAAAPSDASQRPRERRWNGVRPPPPPRTTNPRIAAGPEREFREALREVLVLALRVDPQNPHADALASLQAAIERFNRRGYVHRSLGRFSASITDQFAVIVRFLSRNVEYQAGLEWSPGHGLVLAMAPRLEGDECRVIDLALPLRVARAAHPSYSSLDAIELGRGPTSTDARRAAETFIRTKYRPLREKAQAVHRLTQLILASRDWDPQRALGASESAVLDEFNAAAFELPAIFATETESTKRGRLSFSPVMNRDLVIAQLERGARYRLGAFWIRGQGLVLTTARFAEKGSRVVEWTSYLAARYHETLRAATKEREMSSNEDEGEEAKLPARESPITVPIVIRVPGAADIQQATREELHRQAWGQALIAARDIEPTRATPEEIDTIRSRFKRLEAETILLPATDMGDVSLAVDSRRDLVLERVAPRLTPEEVKNGTRQPSVFSLQAEWIDGHGPMLLLANGKEVRVYNAAPRREGAGHRFALGKAGGRTQARALFLAYVDSIPRLETNARTEDAVADLVASFASLNRDDREAEAAFVFAVEAFDRGHWTLRLSGNHWSLNGAGLPKAMGFGMLQEDTRYWVRARWIENYGLFLFFVEDSQRPSHVRTFDIEAYRRSAPNYNGPRVAIPTEGVYTARSDRAQGAWEEAVARVEYILLIRHVTQSLLRTGHLSRLVLDWITRFNRQGFVIYSTATGVFSTTPITDRQPHDRHGKGHLLDVRRLGPTEANRLSLEGRGPSQMPELVLSSQKAVRVYDLAPYLADAAKPETTLTTLRPIAKRGDRDYASPLPGVEGPQTYDEHERVIDAFLTRFYAGEFGGFVKAVPVPWTAPSTRAAIAFLEWLGIPDLVRRFEALVGDVDAGGQAKRGIWRVVRLASAPAGVRLPAVAAHISHRRGYLFYDAKDPATVEREIGLLLHEFGADLRLPHELNVWLERLATAFARRHLPHAILSAA